MEKLGKTKTKYLEKLEFLKEKFEHFSIDLSAGGKKFFLLYLLYEVQRTHEFFMEVEKLVDEKKYTADMLEIDADVDYVDWADERHWKVDVSTHILAEDEDFEPTEKTIEGMLDALPTEGSEQCAEGSRMEYKEVLQEVLRGACNSRQLYLALVDLIQQLRTTLFNIGSKQGKRELSAGEGELLYQGEEQRFNLPGEREVVEDFNSWKACHENDEENIRKYIRGKEFTEMVDLFTSGFLTPKIGQQKEVDFSVYKDDIDMERLRKFSGELDIEAYYSAMRELFDYHKSVLYPRKDKLGKYFFKYRKEVTKEHRAACFRFVKMLWLIEEEKRCQREVQEGAKRKKELLPTETGRSDFYKIVQHEDPERFVRRLHQLIDGRRGADVGCVLLKCAQEGYISRSPKQKEFESEFTRIGGWKAIHNYMSDNNENALERANKIVIF